MQKKLFYSTLFTVNRKFNNLRIIAIIVTRSRELNAISLKALGATVDWNLFVTKFFCEYLRVFEIAKNTIAKNFNGYIVFIVVTNFRKDFSIAKNFPSRFPDIFANIFKRKIIPVYNIIQNIAELSKNIIIFFTLKYLCTQYTRSTSLSLLCNAVNTHPRRRERSCRWQRRQESSSLYFSLPSLCPGRHRRSS